LQIGENCILSNNAYDHDQTGVASDIQWRISEIKRKKTSRDSQHGKYEDKKSDKKILE